MHKSSTIVTLALGVAVVTGVIPAVAGGFAIREQSAYGQGSSFAGMAAPGDSISSMFWNPAAVTIVTNPTVEGNVTLIDPQSTLDVDLSRSTLAGYGITGNGGNVGKLALVPGTYFATPLSDRLFLGMSVTVPYGLSTTSSAPWVGMFSHLAADVKSVNVSPVVGVKVNDVVSLGFGLQVQYFDVNIETALAPTASPPRQTVGGNDVGFGFVAGLTLTPFDGTTIGLGYRSAVKQSLDGSQSFAIPVVTPLGTIPAGSYPVSADLTLPETVSVGVRQRINDAFSVMAGMEWMNWSRVQTIPFVGSPAGTALALNYKDGWLFSVGGEYRLNPDLTLRAGVGYEISPTRNADRSMRLPDADRVWASIGASYHWNKRLTIDAGYSHLFVADGPVDETTSGIRYAGTAKTQADTISIGLRYKFGG